LKANRFKRKRRPSDPPGTKRVRYRDDPGGSGREIARELVLCAACAAAAIQGASSKTSPIAASNSANAAARKRVCSSSRAAPRSFPVYRR